MSETETQIQLENIDEAEIEEMSSETGLEKDILRSSIESERADSMYERASSEVDESNDSEGKVDSVKNALLFTVNSLVRNPQVPKSGVVVDVRTSDVGDYIEIDVECEYPQIPGEKVSDDVMSKTFKYSLESEVRDLEFLMSKAGVDKPSQLMNESIPISLQNPDKSRSIDRSSFDLYDHNSTIADKFNYTLERVMVYTKSVERYSSYSSGNGSINGQWFINRNAVLFGSLVFGLIHLVFGSISTSGGRFVAGLAAMTMFMGAVLALVYGCLVLRGFLYGLSDVVNKESSERDYIRHIIKK